MLLGLRKLCVVPHGSFEARGFARAVELAARGVREDLVGRRTRASPPRTRCGARRGLRDASAVAASVTDRP